MNISMNTRKYMRNAWKWNGVIEIRLIAHRKFLILQWLSFKKVDRKPREYESTENKNAAC